eukprot:UN32072
MNNNIKDDLKLDPRRSSLNSSIVSELGVRPPTPKVEGVSDRPPPEKKHINL